MGIKLRDLITSDRPTKWVQYKETFEVQVRFIPRSRISIMSTEATISKWDNKAHQRKDSLDPELLARSFAREAIVGWRGLTIGLLVQMVPVKADGVKSLSALTPVDYDEENAAELLLASADFDLFVREHVLDISQFRPKDEALHLGNSASSQSGS